MAAPLPSASVTNLKVLLIISHGPLSLKEINAVLTDIGVVVDCGPTVISDLKSTILLGGRTTSLWVYLRIRDRKSVRRL